MSVYLKPTVIQSADLSEGIYAASGAANAGGNTTTSASSGSGASYTYSLKQTNSWDGNKQYNITFKNNTDETINSITVTVKCHGNITSIGGNVTGFSNGDGTATITFGNYNNPISANSECKDIYTHVQGTGDFGLE